METTIEEAIGVQYDSRRQTQPSFSLPQSTRAGASQLYVSAKHSSAPSLRDAARMPGPGTYAPKRQRSAPSVGFGSGETSTVASNQVAAFTCADLLGESPNANATMRRPSSAVIGSAARYAQANAPDLDAFPMGASSPGPRYKPEWCASRAAPQYSMGVRSNGAADPRPSTPSKVGPGLYCKCDGIGEQFRQSTHPTSPGWSMGKRWKSDSSKGRAAGKRSGPASSQSGIGTRAARPTSAPSGFSFGKSSRGCNVVQPQTELDAGPAGKMGPVRLGHPDLPACKLFK